MSLPVLLSARLRLEPLGRQHAEGLVALDTDPEVMRYLDPVRDRARVLAAWEPTISGGPAPGRRYWAGLDGDGDFVGWWGLHSDPDDPGCAEIGYRLRPEHWGQGYATEGCLTLLRHGFGTLHLRRVWAQTMAVNTGSRRVLERSGLDDEGTWVQEWADPLPGSELGEVQYGVSREDWLASRAAGGDC